MLKKIFFPNWEFSSDLECSVICGAIGLANNLMINEKWIWLCGYFCQLWEGFLP